MVPTSKDLKEERKRLVSYAAQIPKQRTPGRKQTPYPLCHKSSFNPCCNVHGFFFLKTSYVSLIYKCRIVLKIFMILSVPLSASIFLNLLLIHIFRDLSPYRPFQELNMKTKCLPMCTEQLSLLQKTWDHKLFEKFQIRQVSGGLFSHLPPITLPVD